MDFAQVDQRYSELRQQYIAGTLSAEAFDEALKEMMVQDADGRWWSKSRDTGTWNYYDEGSGQWIQAQPPVASPQVAPPPPAQPVAPSPQQAYYGGAAPAQAATPEVSSGLAILFYVASFVIPLVGIILFFVYRNKPHPSDKNVAKISLIVAIVSIVLGCLLGLLVGACGGSSYYYY